MVSVQKIVDHQQFQKGMGFGFCENLDPQMQVEGKNAQQIKQRTALVLSLPEWSKTNTLSTKTAKPLSPKLSGYSHITTKGFDQIKSPLDNLDI